MVNLVISLRFFTFDLIRFECFIMTKYYVHKIKNKSTEKWTVRQVQKFLRPTINVVHQARNVFFIRGDTYSRDSIDNITFSLHLVLNTCREKGIQSFLTIPDTLNYSCLNWIELSFILTYHLHKQAIQMLCNFFKSQWVHNVVIIMARYDCG